MALDEATLAAELLGISEDPSDTEAAAVIAFAAAFNVYMLESTVGGNEMVASFGTTAKDAMALALPGMNASGAAAAKIQAGVIAYWGALAVAGVWDVTLTPTTPPTALATLGAALQTVFDANALPPGKTAAQSTDALAAVWHPLMLGGFASLPGPVVTAIL